jgi:hypothetical protein
MRTIVVSLDESTRTPARSKPELKNRSSAPHYPITQNPIADLGLSLSVVGLTLFICRMSGRDGARL